MNIQILLETTDFLIVNKPSGLMVHPSTALRTSADGKKVGPTLTDWILEHYPEIKGVGEPMGAIDRPGIVHRLDEETSGVLIIAKTQTSFEYFKQLFMNREVEKEYHVFVWGHFKESDGVVDQPIGRSSGDFRRWLSGRGTRGETRQAVTKWQVVKQFTDEEDQSFSFMHLFPKTGRTHQLRVHMKYLQRPIVSDSLYAPAKSQALGFRRLALHAYKISFVAPNGEPVEVVAPYPIDFEQAVAKYCHM